MGTIRDFAIENNVCPCKLAKYMLRVRAQLVENRRTEKKWVVAYIAMGRIKYWGQYLHAS